MRRLMDRLMGYLLALAFMLSIDFFPFDPDFITSLTTPDPDPISNLYHVVSARVFSAARANPRDIISQTLMTASHIALTVLVTGRPPLPERLALAQNYPNPFNSSTVVQYTVIEPGLVNLEVYDILGRKVATLVNEIQQPGDHSYLWDATGQASGVYLYRMTANGFEQSRKMVLVK